MRYYAIIYDVTERACEIHIQMYAIYRYVPCICIRMHMQTEPHFIFHIVPVWCHVVCVCHRMAAYFTMLQGVAPCCNAMQ